MDAKNARQLPEMFRHRVAESGGASAFLVRKNSGEFEGISWREVGDRVERLCAGWIAAGLSAGQKVGILAPYGLEWIVIDWSIILAGGLPVPLFNNLLPKETAEYLEIARVDWVVLENAEVAAELRKFSARAQIVVVSGGGHQTLDELRARGADNFDDHLREAARRETLITPDSLATVACTSGTTGRPKGVALTHKNCLAAFRALWSTGIWDPSILKSGALLFLPMAHTFARVALFGACMFGVPVAISTPATLKEDLLRLEPGVIPSVPLVYQRIFDGVMARVRTASFFKRGLFALSMAIGLARTRRIHAQRAIPGWLRILHARFDRAVLGRLRAAIGFSRIHALISGSVAIPTRVQNFYWALGLELLEGYGSTETGGVLTCNPWRAPVIGTVGKPLLGAELKIGDDGELLARGDMIAREYVDGTPILDRDGWFHTADVGTIDENGYVRLAGRKQDLIKTAGGYRVVPYPIEQKLEEHPAVEFAVLVGEGKPFLCALLCLAPGVEPTKEVECELDTWIAGVNAELEGHRQIKKHLIVPEAVTPASGLVTPSMKVRRNALRARLDRQISQIYK